ncbi:MAG: iron ABC transporter permease [Thermoleophilia bacterium]
MPSAARLRPQGVPLAYGALAFLVAGAVGVTPLVYLGARALGADRQTWNLLSARAIADLAVDTALLAFGVTGASLGIGLPLAWLVARTNLPARRLWGALAPLPLVIPSFVGALVLEAGLAPHGLAQAVLEPFGVQALPEPRGYLGVLLVLTLSTYPYVFLLASSALRSIDTSLEEAARSLGLSSLSTFARVTLPALRPALVSAALLVSLYVLSDFGAVSIMGYSTLTTAIYIRYESLLAREAAAILSLVLVGMAWAIVLAGGRSRGGRGVVYRSGPGSGRMPPPVQLGRWRWPAVAFPASVTLAFLAGPLAVLAWWTVAAAPADSSFRLSWGAAASSAWISLLAAGVATVAVLPAAMLSWRWPSPLSRFVERLTLLPSGLPGIAVGLSLVFLGARLGSLLYQSVGLLVLGYVTRFAPYALAAVRASLEGVSPRVEEAARSLGRRPARALVAVVLPLARPGILAGAVLVFLKTVTELPATLLLRPIGFETLATEIWQGTAVGAYSTVAPAALLLMALALPIVLLVGRRTSWELAAPG